MNRREFIRNTVAAAAASSAFPQFMTRALAAPKRGPNERIRVGFIGAGGRARQLMTGEGLSNHADIVAVADCFLPRADEAVAKYLKPSVKTYQDYRRMFEKEQLDAVFVATTTHARALVVIHAMQAGLDVYAEKPLTLTIAEGRVLARAVAKYQRVLQVGTQQRSMPINIWACRRIQEGAIGKLKEVITCNFTPPTRWTPKPEQPIPAGLDWDMWCNQTELRPYHPDLQFKWPIWWDYDGGGQSWGVSGWGTHSLDQAHAGMGADDTGPVEIWPEESGPQARVTMRYANGTLLKLHGKKRDHADLGAIFVGEKGTLEIMRGRLAADPKELIQDAPPGTQEGPGEAVEHLKNFFDCMRSRKQPNAPVEAAHRSNTVCHLVNICRDLGRKLKWDPKAERFEGDEEANKLISRPRRKGYELPEEFLT